MKASWFRKQGYVSVDRQGLAVLLWKPFIGNATPPQWLRPAKKPGRHEEGKVCVTAFLNGWCPAQNLTFERTRRACEDLGEDAMFRTIDTLDKKNLREWGIPDGVFINGKKIGWGPPLTYKKIQRKIAKQTGKLP